MSKHNRLLALSGGGYRAMLFHVGALWRLNELGELGQLTHVSSVSGGSIVAGLLAARWAELGFDHDGIGTRFVGLVATPLMELARHDIDVPAALIGTLLPLTCPAARLESEYEARLYGARRLADLPQIPQFLFNATNCQTGAVWAFSRERMGDAALGTVDSSDVPLARAVAASSAFPPFLAPLKLRLARAKWQDYPRDVDSLRAYDDLSIRLSPLLDHDVERFRSAVVLADGGIADNLGIASLWRTSGDLFISDGGGTPPLQIRPRRNWLSQLLRTVNLIHEQPSQLRAFAAISQFANHDERRLIASRSTRTDGAYWNMRWPPESHNDVEFAEVDEQLINRLAQLRTALWPLDEITQKQLVNWGYVAANRSLPYIERLWGPSGADIFAERRLPFPEATVFTRAPQGGAGFNARLIDAQGNPRRPVPRP